MAMKEKLLILGLIVTGLMLTMPGKGACFTVTAQVDKTQITPEETVSLQVVVDGGKAEVDLSAIQDFKIVSSATSTSRSYINGNWQHQVIYQYLLVPRKTGTLKIPSLKVSQDREIQMTQEIQIQMSEKPLAKDQPRQLFGQAQVSATDLVVGQQMVYTFKLYAAAKFARASLEAPSFDGFTAKEVEDRKNYTQNINGIPYLVNEINYILQANQPGQFEIEPARVMADLVVGQGTDPFGSFFNNSFFSSSRTKSVQIASNPVSLTVSPLPAYSGDQPFSGLVGQFTLAAALDKPRLAAGESATLTITLQGQGNIMDAACPALDLDPGLVKIYEDTPAEEILATEKGFSGKKTFKQALVPRQAGTLTLPPLSLVYYDVTAKGYRSLGTEGIQVEVTGADPLLTTDTRGKTDSQANGLPGAGSGKSLEKQEVVIKNQDILDIKDRVSILSSTFQLGFPLFVLLVLAPGLLYGIALGIFRLHTREKSTGLVMMEKARQAVKRAEKLAREGHPFLQQLQAGLVAAILSKGGKQGESVTQEEARQILVQAGTGQELLDETMEMMETMDAVRFGGKKMDPAKAGFYLGRVPQMIKMLGLVLFCLALFSQLPALAKELPGQTGTTAAFIDGIKLYQAEAFEAAAKSFETIAQNGVINPDLYYNIGNAYLKSRDLGHAILWYERARRLSPRDPDLNFNLAYANTLVKDKIETSLTLADVVFFWQGLVPLNWFQAGAIGASSLFFLWAGIQTFRQKPVFSGPGVTLMVLLIFLTSAAVLDHYRIRAENLAVIVQERVAVRSGIQENATQLFELHAGTRVQVKAQKEGHLKIMLTKGRVGWVKPGDAKVI